MTTMSSAGRQQSVDAPLTRSATFLVLAAEPGQAALDTIRSTLSGVEGLTKNVAIRDLDSQFTCTVGIGSGIWDGLTKLPRPTELRPLPVLQGAVHATVSTPGDLLFHIRSNRRDLCFEFERQLLNKLGKSVQVVDATVGFRYFETRDLLGFVDGTANPVGPAALSAAIVQDGPGGGSGGGGSYVMVQKYLHNLDGWESLKTEDQEAIIGRTKFDNIELDDAESGQRSHKTLTTIEDENGNEHGIVRDNMPFGSPASGEYGTYFIGYSKNLWVMERMLERMFIGHPPGKHDRILDFSTPVTGGTFFAPSVEVLAGLSG
jgi:putative iron-dependent peroxidase